MRIRVIQKPPVTSIDDGLIFTRLNRVSRMKWAPRSVRWWWRKVGDGFMDEPARVNSLAHATILLGEDESAIRRLMSGALERAGYTVLETRNGEEALEVFNADVDLLVTDIRLPYGRGADVVKQLRSRRSR